MDPHAFTVTGPVRLELRVPSADVRVTTGPAGSAEVDFTPTAGRDHEAIEQAVVSCERRGDTDVLTVTMKQRNMFRLRRPLGIAVRLPEGSDVVIATAAGEIRSSGPLGAVRVETASAPVTVPDAASVDVVGVSGDLEIGTVAGEASLKTVSGSIRVTDAGGRMVLRTVSGATRVARAGGDVEARSVSGDVALERLERGIVRVDTVSGDALVAVQPGVAVWLDLDSTSGHVRSELSPAGAGPAEGRPVLEVRGRAVSGDVRVVQAGE